MLGFRPSSKSGLCPLAVLLVAGWLFVVWSIVRPGPTPQARIIARQWVDRCARAYDYWATRLKEHPAETHARKGKELALRQLRILEPAIAEAGLANDAVWIDWALIDFRVAQDATGDEAATWRARSNQALARIAPPVRTSTAYVEAYKAMTGEPLTETEQQNLEHELEVQHGTFTLNFKAALFQLEPAVDDLAMERDRLAAAEVVAEDWFEWLIIVSGFLLIVPAWLCLRQPWSRRPYSERLQRMWRPWPALALTAGAWLAYLSVTHYCIAWLAHWSVWRAFVVQAGRGWAAAMLEVIITGAMIAIPWPGKLGLARGWGSIWRVMGIQWRDFVSPRLWCIGFAAGLLGVAVPQLLHQMLGQLSWGSVLDVTSRWPLSSIPVLTFGSFLQIIIIGPIVEEFVFRGYLLTAFRERWNAAIAGVLTALLFAVGHGYSLWGSVEVFAMGLLLAGLRLRTRRLSVTIMAHMTLNAVCSVEVLLWQLN